MAIGKDSTRMIITIPKELKEQLEQAAKSENRSMSNYILTLLQQNVQKGSQ